MRSLSAFELVPRWIVALLEDGLPFADLQSPEGVAMTDMGLGNLIEALYKSDALDMLKLKEDACAFAISVVCREFFFPRTWDKANCNLAPAEHFGSVSLCACSRSTPAC